MSYAATVAGARVRVAGDDIRKAVGMSYAATLAGAT